MSSHEQRILKTTLQRAVKNGLEWPEKHSGNYLMLDRDKYIRDTVFTLHKHNKTDPFEWSVFTVTREESHNAFPFPLPFFKRAFSRTFFGDDWEKKWSEFIQNDDPLAYLEQHI